MPHRDAVRTQDRASARTVRQGYGSASTPATPGSGWPAATRPGCWRPRSRPSSAGRGDLARIAELLAEEQDGDPERVLEVVVGLPRSLSGGEGPAAVKVREWARRLARSVAPVPVRLADERLTTVSAEAMLRDRGRSGAKRRAVVDQAAAVVILQHVLDTERASGTAPGEIIEGTD